MNPAPESVLVAFATCTQDLWPTLIENLSAVRPGLPVYVVAEHHPGEGAKWIQYFPERTVAQNLARLRSLLSGKRIEFAAYVTQPNYQHWQLRWLAVRIAPSRLLVFNEDLNHFRLHPRSAAQIIRHSLWRLRNLYEWETNPGGRLYTQVWRLFHPRAFHRPLLHSAARLAGWLAATKKSSVTPSPLPPRSGLSPGVTVVVPSRDGRGLLATLLPGLVRELANFPSEIRVIDNGSSDGTAAWLAAEYPQVKVDISPAPLSFAAAVNRGIRAAQYSHTCLLNNDMVLEPGFFEPLRSAFDRVPDLFCATAEILFPEGVRREETGKAVWSREAGPADFPIRCDLPIPGEDLSYVLYGSGGCSLYDTQKLRALGAVGEVFRPAYVEDLDLGYRGWVRGWPSVFAAGARVTHFHRSTTKKFFQPQEIQQAVEINYLRFLARSVSDPGQFKRLWEKALDRLNLLASQHDAPASATAALRAARHAADWVEPAPRSAFPEEQILAAGSGELAVFPGRPRTGKPAVLVASPYLPFPLSHGGAVRMFNLMREAARDFSQILVCFVDELKPPAPELLALFEEIVLVRRKGSHRLPMTDRPEVVEEFDSPAFRAALRLMIRKWNVSLVQLEFTQLAQYASECGRLPTLMVEHDITLDLYQQLLQHGDTWDLRQQYERWVRFERDAWRRVTRVITMSEKDTAMVTGGHPVALPNGVDIERFQPLGQEPDPGRILFIGSFAHLPNLMAVDFFVREVWPHLASAEPVFHVIAGARHREALNTHRDRVQLDLSIPGLEVEDYVADVRGAYARAAIVVVPLPASAGTNIKVFEAMAMGKAIVSTPAGINGLELRNGEEVVVVQTGEEMAAAILRLLRDPDARRRLEATARESAERDWSWTEIGRRQKRIYEELIAQGATVSETAKSPSRTRSR